MPKRSSVISIRLDDAEKQALEDDAKKYGIPISTYLKFLIAQSRKQEVYEMITPLGTITLERKTK